MIKISSIPAGARSSADVTSATGQFLVKKIEAISTQIRENDLLQNTGQFAAIPHRLPKYVRQHRDSRSEPQGPRF